jgi:hypothetical protein
VSSLRIGWYHSWRTLDEPNHPAGVEYYQSIRLRDDTGDPAFDYWPPNWGYVAQTIERNPGATWLIGNEPDVQSQDNCTPDEYARRYHEAATFIKSLDPTAKVSAAGIVQASPLRLAWLDRALQSYERMYGAPMPVDVWNLHVQILPERAGSWGCQIPPGMPDEAGLDYQVADNARVDLFQENVIAFRTWMAERGYRNLPLVISEYGVLMPSGHGYLGGWDEALGNEIVKQYMTGTFDFSLEASDPDIGQPEDEYRLVQRWAWYSMSHAMSDFRDPTNPALGFNGSLFYVDSGYPGVLTQFGRHYRDYVANLLCD